MERYLTTCLALDGGAQLRLGGFRSARLEGACEDFLHLPLAVAERKMPLLCFLNFSAQLRVEPRKKAGEGRLVDEFKFERRADSWQFTSPLVLRDSGERTMSEKRGYPLLRVAGALPRDPESISCKGVVSMILGHG